MTIAVDVAVRQLDPSWAAARLLKEIDDTVIICGVDACFARETQIRHTGDVGQLACWLGLQVTSPGCEGVITHPGLVELCVIAHWRVIAEVSVGQSPQAEVRSRVERCTVVPERLSTVLQVDVASDVLRAIVGDDNGVLCTRGVRDEVRRAQELEERTTRRTHGCLAVRPVISEWNDPFAEGCQVWVALLPSSGPLGVQNRLWVGWVQLWGCEATYDTLNCSGVP